MSTSTTPSTRYQHLRVEHPRNGSVHLLAIDCDGNVGTTGGEHGAWLCKIGSVCRAVDGIGWRYRTYAEEGEQPSHTGYVSTRKAGMRKLLALNPGAAGMERPLASAPDRVGG